MSIGSSSGPAGVTIIVAACISVAVIISATTGSFFHWPFVAAGILVGLWAVQSISK